jgi:peptidoglycan/xylan/chitin deacetylase (PgdA/CDA1 family)
MADILLSFDVEEFDLPLEYGIPISKDEQMSVGKKGLDEISKFLKETDILCTLFTTANFALHFPTQIAELSQRHEIASHTFFHSSFEKDDLLKSRLELETITSKKVYGLRMPRMKKIEGSWIKDAGYKYDSSINPTWIPGRYNNLSKPRTIYMESGVPKIPVSVSPNFRIPLFWLAFKNFPYFYFKRTALQTLKKDGYLSLYFHPWEFTDLSSYKLPNMVKRTSGKELLDKLKQLIGSLKNEGDFITMNSFSDKKYPEVDKSVRL